MAKTIFSGAEDSGKSYMLAETCMKLADRNAAWLKLTGIPRPIVSNLRFSPWFVEELESMGIPIRYWQDLEELEDLKECDLIIDEVGTYFDSRGFKDLPLSIRLWLAQASKMGCDIYGSAQDFAQVDVSFRRLVASTGGGLFHITKLIGSDRPAATKPPVKRIWGVCTMRELDPVAYDEESKKFSGSAWPKIFFLRAAVCRVFDTTARIPKSSPPPYKHIARRCTVPGCRMGLHEIHDGVHYRVTHV